MPFCILLLTTLNKSELQMCKEKGKIKARNVIFDFDIIRSTKEISTLSSTTN